MSSKFIVPLKLLELNAVPALSTSDWHNLYYRQGYLKNYKSSEKDVVLDRPLDGFTPTVCLPIVATDTVLQAFEKLQCQINSIPISPPQINSDWLATSGVAEILNKPVLSTVATTGDYFDLLNIPPTPAQVIAVTGSTLYSTNPPAGPTVHTNNSIFFGFESGRFSATQAPFSVALGYQSAANLGGGTSVGSVYLGPYVGTFSAASPRSVMMGYYTGYGHSNAFEAVFIGNGAGASGGFYGSSFGCVKSLFIGAQCGEGAKNVVDSCAIGSSAMRGASGNNQCVSLNVGSFEASSNNLRVIGIGTNSARVINNNTDCIGIGFSTFSGSNNSNNIIGIGYQAAANNNNVNNVIALGYNAGNGNNKSNQFIISDSNLPLYVNSADAASNLASPGSPSGTRYLWIDLSDNNTVKAYIVP